MTLINTIRTYTHLSTVNEFITDPFTIFGGIIRLAVAKDSSSCYVNIFETPSANNTPYPDEGILVNPGQDLYISVQKSQKITVTKIIPGIQTTVKYGDYSSTFENFQKVSLTYTSDRSYNNIGFDYVDVIDANYDGFTVDVDTSSRLPFVGFGIITSQYKLSVTSVDTNPTILQYSDVIYQP